MEEYIVNILPDKLMTRQNKHEYVYDFLKIMDDDFMENYYDLIRSIDLFKIKNIYHYIYLRIILINKIFPEIELLEKKTKLTPDDFNNLLKSYISTKVDAIIIMNSIQQYFIPIKNI